MNIYSSLKGKIYVNLNQGLIEFKARYLDQEINWVVDDSNVLEYDFSKFY